MLSKLYSGKVRDIYDAGDGNLLMVASDRISVFDVVLDEPVPDKGRVLTAMTSFWDAELRRRRADASAQHRPGRPSQPRPARSAISPVGRCSCDVQRCCRSSASCAATSPDRPGANTSVAFADDARHALPAGLLESERLPEPVFTPSTKASEGHDENISFELAAELVGDKLAIKAERDLARRLRRGAEMALEHGIIIADTKFELGFIDGELAICDEILTPDSSRFWPMEEWRPGSAPPSYDKQPVRDWAESTGWDKASSPPAMSEAVIRRDARPLRRGLREVVRPILRLLVGRDREPVHELLGSRRGLLARGDG